MIPARSQSFLMVIFLFLLSIFLGVKSMIFGETKSSESIKHGTMYVKDRHLYTSANEKVILRGVNEMIIWSNDHTGKTILPQISMTGANCIRLVWTTEGSTHSLDKLIENTLLNKMIPMVELHDATGDWSKLPVVMDYWKRPDVIKVIDKYKEWVLLNIANEVGDNNVKDSVFIADYKKCITELRNAGYAMPLIIDAPGWGQDEKMILRTWKDLLSHDPLKNVMFSMHTYWTDQAAEQRLESFLDHVVKDSIPFIIGEGPQQNGWDCKTPFPWKQCLNLCQQYEVGWLAWSWGTVINGDCKENRAFDITTDGKYGNWANDWGRLIAVDDPNSIKNTSVIPASLNKAYSKMKKDGGLR